MSVIVRTITSEEMENRVEELVRPLGDAFFREKELPGCFVPKLFIDTVKVMEQQGCGGAWIAEDSETKVVHGALGWIIAPVFFSDARMLTDMFFYVFPEYRSNKSRAAFALLKTFLQKGEEEKIQIRLFHFGVDTNDPVGKLYKRHGFVPLETGYWRR